MPVLEPRHRGLQLGTLRAQRSFQRSASLPLAFGELRLELRRPDRHPPLQIAGHPGAEIFRRLPDFRLALGPQQLQGFQNARLLDRKRFDGGRQVALALSQQFHLPEQRGTLTLQARNFGIELGACPAQRRFQGFAALSLPVGEIRLELRQADGSAPLQFAGHLAAEMFSGLPDVRLALRPKRRKVAPQFRGKFLEQNFALGFDRLLRDRRDLGFEQGLYFGIVAQHLVVSAQNILLVGEHRSEVADPKDFLRDAGIDRLGGRGASLQAVGKSPERLRELTKRRVLAGFDPGQRPDDPAHEIGVARPIQRADLHESLARVQDRHGVRSGRHGEAELRVEAPYRKAAHLF